MLRGHTKKEEAHKEKEQNLVIKTLLGEDFASKYKSMRRNTYRDYRKTNGPGDASFRRYMKNKALKKNK